MKQLFEPVIFTDHKSLIWDYQLYTDDYYKGYYHWHQCCEIMYIHSGQGNVVVNQQMYDIRSGMLFFFQPYQLHRIYSEVSAECPFVRSIFYVDPHTAENLLKDFPKRRRSSLPYGRARTPIAGLISAVRMRPYNGFIPSMISAGPIPQWKIPRILQCCLRNY